MSLFSNSIFFIAVRYTRGTKKQRFASFVATLATLGIAIGVCALIVVSSIMQGLQERLKENILSDCAHLVVKAQVQDIPYLLSLNNVNALVPFVQGESMMQFGSEIAMVTLQATDNNSLYLSKDYAQKLGISEQDVANFKQRGVHSGDEVKSTDEPLTYVTGEKVIKIPLMEFDSLGYAYGSLFNFEPGSYHLAVNYMQVSQMGIELSYDSKVRLISTQNARYTPFGITPVARNFEVSALINSLDKSPAPTVVGNYEDVSRFLRLGKGEHYYRLYLSDPFLIEETLSTLDKKFAYTDWRSRYGDFFKAVGLEKISMSLMLCLIVVVAAFNILSSLTMMVSSRVSEIAILKTIGMPSSSILAIFGLLGMSSGIIGSLVGVIAGIPLAYNAQAILSTIGISIVQGELPVVVNPMNIVVICVLSLGVSLLCTFYPSYVAAKADPASNLVNS
ncbi:MAG: FtsX-like permease family protein [Anaerobiospirillum succiniciproducens]|uniref:FtsX-like permease family protein n=1 Tax=Anaerobiospirillum succiniciproducens TaxID=13335 RepID=UPI00235551F8|nr:FtsX-like permease family protein [Anaerobiospirillum succiniciproducens]MCI6864135.1 FtsX-like permease family protein [Anaerobiospirillum succiniciproducens]MDY2798698.1 FtsX-like permease family protein [Anaerobiospirillum succiniciproducens]